MINMIIMMMMIIIIIIQCCKFRNCPEIFLPTKKMMKLFVHVIAITKTNITIFLLQKIFSFFREMSNELCVKLTPAKETSHTIMAKK